VRGEFDQAPEFSRAPQMGGAFGLLFVLKRIAEALGIGPALGHSRLAKLAMLLVLARVAHQGSRPSAVRWARDQAMAEVLGLGKFDEDDLYAALEDLEARQRKIEKTLYRGWRRHWVDVCVPAMHRDLPCPGFRAAGQSPRCSK
jgi:hypothetical protein